jgi:hypothetical protein
VRLPPAYGKRMNAGLRSRRAVLCASLLWLAFTKESYRLSLDLRSVVRQKASSIEGPVRFRSKFYFDRNSNVNAPRDPLTSSRGYLRPSFARPLGGPRISSATWHRLVSAAGCLGTCSAPAWHLPGTCLAPTWHLLVAWHLLRGTTSSLWPCLCTPAACTGIGAPARSTSYWGNLLSESNEQAPTTAQQSAEPAIFF